MAEKLVFDVIARASGANDVKKLGAAIDDVGKSADRLDGKSGGGGFFTKFADSAKGASTSVGASLSKISSTFAAFKTGIQGSGVEAAQAFVNGFKTVDGKLRDSNNKIVKSGSDTAKKYAEALAKIGDDDRGAFGKLAEKAGAAGAKAGSALASGITSGLEALGPGGPYAGAAIFAGIIAAAPIAGAAIGAAITAGVAAAGIGAGVALALQDPGIKAAGAELGTTVMDGLTKAAEPFKAATLAAFDQLGAAWQRSVGDIGKTFSSLAPMVAPLAADLGGAVNALTKGISDLSAGAGPVIAALGQGIQLVASSIGDGFSRLKEEGPAMATVLLGVFDTIGLAIDAVFFTVEKLTQAFGWLAEHGLLGDDVKASYDNFKTSLDGAKTGMDGLRTSTEAASPAQQLASQQTQILTSSFTDAANAAGGLKTALDTLNGSALTGVQSEVAYKAALDGVTTSVKTNGTSLDANTSAGRANITAFTQAISTAQQYASANNLSASEVEALRSNIIKQAEAAGLDSGKVQALTADLFKIPGEVNPKITIMGYDEAKRQVAAIDASLRGLPKTVQTQIITQHLDVYNAVGAGSTNAAENRARALGGIDLKMAQGGAITSHFVRSPTVLYGERGDEAYIAKDAPTGRSRAIAQQVVEKWLGGKVAWPGTGGSARSLRPTGGGSGGGGDVAILAALARLTAAVEAGGHVYLDNRLVGAVQGRQSDLYERAG